MSLKLSKPRMLSTVFDIQSMLREVSSELLNMSTQSSIIRYAGEIEDKIAEADDIIFSKLRPIYGDDGATTSPYRTITPTCSSPFYTSSNTGTARLTSVQTNYSSSNPPYTAGWFVTFSSSSVYGLTSTLEGVQSATASTGCSTSTNSTSTNGDITILATAWTGTPASGDKFYFSYIDCYRLLNRLSKTLSASFVLNEIFVGQTPADSQYINNWYSMAMKILDRLSRPDDPDGMSLSSLPLMDLTPTQVGVAFDENGEYDSDLAMTDVTDTYNS
jgi:hypothetical protein